MENYNSILSEVSERILSLLTGLNSYRSPYAKTIGEPSDFIDGLTQKASIQSALASGALSLPTGAFGAITLAPETFLVLRIQGKLIKDIAALYGKESQVTEELMAYCLFNDRTSIFRNILREVGSRILIRPATWELMRQGILRVAKSLRNSSSSGGKKRGIWISLLGSALSGGLSYSETKKVAHRAQSVFSKEIVSVPSDEPWVEETA
ncbi:hypothetical protein EHO61_05210 [Leptospira fluminis]|uniref:EcsC family protein n=1 Tax=Leptospira fluminis TaxID=2484979 RepID=A0A4R9GT80_9LEPT|nr:hypothetical protein [Leptospira fluminis]TGK21243.1 hypothetical protein EHO61_05210 [Leptospira fluminis]